TLTGELILVVVSPGDSGAVQFNDARAVSDRVVGVMEAGNRCSIRSDVRKLEQPIRIVVRVGGACTVALVLNLHAIGRIVIPSSSVILGIQHEPNAPSVVVARCEAAPSRFLHVAPLPDWIVDVCNSLARCVHNATKPMECVKGVRCAA